MAMEKLEEARKKSLEEYEKQKQKLDEECNKAITSSKSDDLVTALNEANKAVDNIYKAKHDIYQAQHRAAGDEFRKDQDAVAETYREYADKHHKGEISDDEYKQRRTEYEEGMKQAQDKYKNAVDGLDKGLMQMNKEREQMHQDNKNKLQEFIDAQNKKGPGLSAPHGSVSDPTAKVGVALDQVSETQKKSVKIQSENVEDFIKAFNKKFGEDEWYKKNPPQKNEDGSLNLSFKSDKDMASFFQDQAKEGKSFIMVDGATNKVIGFSNGDGKLYKPGADGNKQEFTGGSLFPTPDELKKLPDKDEFKMPEKEQQSQQTLQN